MDRKDISDILKNCGEKNSHDYNIEMTFPLVGKDKQKKITEKEKTKINKLYNYNNISVKGFGVYDIQNPSKNTNGNRYYLEFSITNPDITDKKTLVTLMMNPAGTFPKTDNNNADIDTTVKNVIKIACVQGYSKIIILNVSSNINPNSEKWESDEDIKKGINTKFVKSCLANLKSEACDFLAAWGSKTKVKNYLKESEYHKQINQFNSYAYRINEKSQTPAHPGNQNTGKVYNFIINREHLIPCKFNADGKINNGEEQC